MKIKPKSDDYYKKYKYLIWRDDIGFLHLETFSSEDLRRFAENIEKQIEDMSETKDDMVLEGDIILDPDS
jgi:hypothetical protein